MAAYFGRQVWVELGPAGGQGKKLVGLRTSFRCHMDRSGTPGTAKIDVYNCAPGTIALAEDPAAVVTLYAGYDAPRAIFTGNPTKHGIAVEKQGPDRILHLELQDGGHRLAVARVNLAYKTKVTLTTVLNACLEALGLPRGVIRLTRDIEFPHGLTLRGPARHVLTRVAQMGHATSTEKGIGQWFVRDGAIYFLGERETTQEPALEVSSKRGNLVGSPTQKDKGLEVRALLDPGIRPGRRVVVVGAHVRGTYSVQAVDYIGDSGWDASFYAEFLGKEVA